MRDYVLTAFVFGMVPLCVMRPWLGILMWYWLGLMNPHRLTWDFAYTMPFAMAIGLATIVGACLARDRRPIPWQRELALSVVLLAYFLFTTLFAWEPALAWSQLEKVAKIILMTLVATMFIYGKDRVRALMWVIAMSLGYYGIKGGIWSILNGGAEQVLGPEGSFIEGNTFLSLALNMVIPVMVSLAQEEPRPWVRRFLYAGAGLSVIASFFTYSRGGWLGLAVVLGMFMLRLRWSARIGLGMAVLVIALGAQSLLPERVFSRADSLENYEEDCSANQRFMSWTVNWNIAKEYPVTGAGFQFDESGDPRWLRYGDQKYLGCFGDYVSSSAHSIYFQILGQHGFVALFLFLLLLFLSMRKLSGLRRATRADPENRWIGTYATGLQIGLLAYAVSGAFLSSAYFDLAWLYYALTDIFARELADARAKQGAVVIQPSGAPRVGVIRAGQTT